MTLTAPEVSTFVEFPDRLGLLHRLRSIEVYEMGMEPLFQLIADRLERKAYDRSAFVFILLELIYELDLDTITFSDMLGRLVFSLTEDLDLVGEALEAFSEIQQTLKEPEPEESSRVVNGRQMALVGSKGGSASSAKAGGTGSKPDTPGFWPDHEPLMSDLQMTQKSCLESGLSARMAIEMALTRSNRDNVGKALREISSLRHQLLRFEELLRESEEAMLEAIGILGHDD